MLKKKEHYRYVWVFICRLKFCLIVGLRRPKVLKIKSINALLENVITSHFFSEFISGHFYLIPAVLISKRPSLSVISLWNTPVISCCFCLNVRTANHITGFILRNRRKYHWISQKIYIWKQKNGIHTNYLQQTVLKKLSLRHLKKKIMVILFCLHLVMIVSITMSNNLFNFEHFGSAHTCMVFCRYVICAISPPGIRYCYEFNTFNLDFYWILEYGLVLEEIKQRTESSWCHTAKTGGLNKILRQ